MAEEWRPIPSDSRYEVSNQGRIRRASNQRVRKLTPNRYGYLATVLSRPGGAVAIYAHRAVAEAFVPGAGPVVRHLDGDRLNNTPDNLAWGSASENNLDTVRHGRHHQANRTRCPQDHPYSGHNLYVDPDGGRHCRLCVAAAARKYRRRRAA